jgi:hypothetical protein
MKPAPPLTPRHDREGAEKKRWVPLTVSVEAVAELSKEFRLGLEANRLEGVVAAEGASWEEGPSLAENRRASTRTPS